MNKENSVESVYRSIAGYYERIFPITDEKLKFLTPLINSRSDVLDIGCNTGELLYHLAPYCNSATGIDPSEASIEIAREKQADTEAHNLNFYKCSMEDLSSVFDSSSFSHIFCLGNTLAHINNIAALNEIVNGFFHVLKPGGHLVLQLVNYNRVLGFQDYAFMPLKKDKIVFQRNYTPLSEPGKIEFHTKIRDYDTGFTSDNSCYLTTLKLPDIKRELQRNRFRNIRIFGNFQRIPWTVESGPLIVSCRKPRHISPVKQIIYC